MIMSLARIRKYLLALRRSRQLLRPLPLALRHLLQQTSTLLETTLLHKFFFLLPHDVCWSLLECKALRQMAEMKLANM